MAPDLKGRRILLEKVAFAKVPRHLMGDKVAKAAARTARRSNVSEYECCRAPAVPMDPIWGWNKRLQEHTGGEPRKERKSITERMEHYLKKAQSKPGRGSRKSGKRTELDLAWLPAAGRRTVKVTRLSKMPRGRKTLEEAKAVLKLQMTSALFQDLPGVAAARMERRRMRKRLVETAEKSKQPKAAETAQNQNKNPRKDLNENHATSQPTERRFPVREASPRKSGEDQGARRVRQEQSGLKKTSTLNISVCTNTGEWPPKLTRTVRNDLYTEKSTNDREQRQDRRKRSFEESLHRETLPKGGESERRFRDRSRDRARRSESAHRHERAPKQYDARSRIESRRRDRSYGDRGCVAGNSKRCDKRAAAFKRLFGSESEED